MKLGQRLKELRKQKRYTLRQLADRVDVDFTYLCKIEKGKLEEGHQPSEKLLHQLAEELDADENELLLLANRIPEPIRRRFMERPEAFAVLAGLRDCDLNRLLETLGSSPIMRDR